MNTNLVYLSGLFSFLFFSFSLGNEGRERQGGREEEKEREEKGGSRRPMGWERRKRRGEKRGKKREALFSFLSHT